MRTIVATNLFFFLIEIYRICANNCCYEFVLFSNTIRSHNCLNGFVVFSNTIYTNNRYNNFSYKIYN